MYPKLAGFYEANRARLPLFIPVAVGAGTAWYFALLNEPEILPFGVALVICIAVAWMWRKHSYILLATIFLAAALLGFINASWQTNRLHAPVLTEPLFWKMVAGHVEAVELDEQSVKITLIHPTIETLPKEQTPNKIRITLKKKLEFPLEVGDEIEIKATLFPLPEPVAPGAFDFGRYLYLQGLGAVGYSTSYPLVTKHQATTSNVIDQFRLDFAQDIMAAMQEPYGAIAAAMTVGEEKAVPEEVNENLRDSGLYHILSISGLHMAIAAGLVFFVVRFLLALSTTLALKYPIKKIAAATALLASFLYLLAAGAPVPAIRSFIMVAVVFVAILCDRKGISMISLGWAALLVLLFQPSAIVSASFQLSFAATAAIIALYERFGSVLYQPNSGIVTKLLVAIIATILVSLVATLATSPFVITHFNRIQLWGLLANAVVSPLTAFVIMPSIVVSFLLWPVGLQHLAYVPLELGLKAMLWISTQVSQIPYASIFLPSFTAWGFVFACIGLCWFLMVRGNGRKAGLLLLAVGFISMAFQTSPDMVIGEKGKLIAVKDAHGSLVMLKGGDKSFTAEQWAKGQGQEAVLDIEQAVWDYRVKALCSKEYCTYSNSGFTSLFIFNPRGTPEFCNSIKPQLMMFNFDLRDNECSDVAHVIDRDTLKQKSAIDIRLEGKQPIIRYAKDLQGNRPWVAQYQP